MLDRQPLEVSLIAHLEELRKRLIISLVFFLLAVCLSFLFVDDLYAFLTSQIGQKLLVLGPNDILMIYLRLASVSGLVVSLPFWTYQIWAFVRPGLTEREARSLLAYMPAVILCFVMGLAIGFWLVSPMLLALLLGLGEGLFDTQLTAESYMAFLFQTTVPLGLFFEFPVVIAFLTQLGLVGPGWLAKYRRYAYFILIVSAVVLTPADLLSDLALSAPLILLYELSIGLSRWIEKRRKT